MGLGGDDTLTGASSDTLDGGPGNDLLQSGYPTCVSYAEASGPLHVNLSLSGPQAVGADQGVDTLIDIRGVIGGAFNDTLLAADTTGTISGGAGADSIVGAAGGAYLSGDSGDDTIDATAGAGLGGGGAGNDLILLSASGQNNVTSGGEGDDRIYNASNGFGDEGNDTITGAHQLGWPDSGALLYGGAGDDSLVGTVGNSELCGAGGNNTIVGAGSDTIFVFQVLHGHDDGAYRNDVIHESGTDNALAVWGGPDGAHATIDLGAGTAHIDVPTAGGAQRIADVTFDHINKVYASHNGDYVVGSAGDDEIQGIYGSNTLFGGDGNDYISTVGDAHNQVNGNKGDDVIVGQSSIGDWLLGGQGDDEIDASASTGHNIINGNLGDDVVRGGSGGDTLRGGQGADLVEGGMGNDWITGDLGSNVLTGRQGADTFRAGAGTDVVTDFAAGQGDHVQVDHGVSYQLSQVGADVHIVLSNGGLMVLQTTQLTSLPAGWIFNS